MKIVRQIPLIQAGFYLIGCIWSIFVVLTFIRAFERSGTLEFWGMVILGVLMLGNAGILLFMGWALGRGWHWVYYLGLAVLGLNILLTFTDQVGFFDVVTFLIDVVLVWLLLGNRAKYFSVE